MQVVLIIPTDSSKCINLMINFKQATLCCTQPS